MKKISVSLAAFLLIVLSQNRLEAGDWRLEEQPTECASGAPSQISARDYSAFLNEVATSDPTHLYDWKMAADLGSPCIQRSGVPGSYCYKAGDWRLEAGDSEKNAAAPILFLSWNDAAQYCQWKNSAASTSTFHFNSSASSYDSDLKSNILTFSITSSAATASQASGVAVAGLSAEEEVAVIVEGMLIILAGGEGDFDQSDRVENNHSLTDAHGIPADGRSQDTRIMNVTPREFESARELENFPNSSSNGVDQHSEGSKGLLEGIAVEETSPNKKIESPKYFPNDVSEKTITIGRIDLSLKAGRVKKVFPENEIEKVNKEYLHNNIPFDLQFHKLPDDIIGSVTSFFKSSEVENASVASKNYKLKYEETFKNLEEKNPGSSAFIKNWKDALEACRSSRPDNEANAFENVVAIEKLMPLGAYFAAAYDDAAEVMGIFDFLQGESFEVLKNQKQKDLSFYLVMTTRNNENMSQAMAQIESRLEMIPTCQEKSGQLIVQANPGIAQEYKNIAISIARLIHGAARIIKKTEMQNARRTRNFLQGDDALKKMLEYQLLKLQEWATNGDTDKAQHLFEAAEAAYHAAIAFDDAVRKTIFPQAIKAYEKVLDYSLQRAEELATNGKTEKEKHLLWAIRSAKSAGVYGNAGRTSRLIKVDERKSDYYLQRAEEVATNGLTDKVRDLDTAIFGLGTLEYCFERAVSNTRSLQAIEAYEKWFEYSLLIKQEYVTNGQTEALQRLNAAGQAAYKAGNLFKPNFLTNDPVKAQYYLKLAEIYEKEGIEAGEAFTFEKYKQQENISDGATCRVM